jgi:hypothetical protein
MFDQQEHSYTVPALQFKSEPSHILSFCTCGARSSCTLDPDSLDPLAQVVSLKQLRLRWCTGVTIATVERLLDTAVQGCWLKVILWCCQPQMMKEAASQLHSKVLAQRGSRDTPVLSVDHDAMV